MLEFKLKSATLHGTLMFSFGNYHYIDCGGNSYKVPKSECRKYVAPKPFTFFPGV